MTTTHTQITEPQRRRMAATWYAFGVADATGASDRSLEFGRFAEAEATEYYSGQTSHLSSVQDQWRRFQETA